jgi:hypothetical protein
MLYIYVIFMMIIIKIILICIVIYILYHFYFKKFGHLDDLSSLSYKLKNVAENTPNIAEMGFVDAEEHLIALRESIPLIPNFIDGKETYILSKIRYAFGVIVNFVEKIVSDIPVIPKVNLSVLDLKTIPKLELEKQKLNPKWLANIVPKTCNILPEDLLNSVVKLFNKFDKILAGLVDDIKSSFDDVKKNTIKDVKDAIDPVLSEIDQLKKIVDDIFNDIKNDIDRSINDIKSKFDKFADDMVILGGDIGDAAKKYTQNMVGNITTGINIYVKTIEMVGNDSIKMLDAIEKLGGVIFKGLTDVKDIKNELTPISSWFNSFISDLEYLGKKINSVIQIKDSYETAYHNLEKAYNSVKSELESAEHDIKELKKVSHDVGKLFCFTENSNIYMSDNNAKQIKDICEGDIILGIGNTYNKVINIEKNETQDIILHSINNEEFMFTKDHPLMAIDDSNGISWKSIDPESTLKDNQYFTDISKLKIGDKLLKLNNGNYIFVTVDAINTHQLDHRLILYNLQTTGKTHSYHVNGYVAHDMYNVENVDNLSIKNRVNMLSKNQFNNLKSTILKEKNILNKAFGVSIMTNIYSIL